MNLYWTTFGKRFRNSQLEPFYVAVCIIIPTVCTIVPVVLGMYTTTFIDDGVGCVPSSPAFLPCCPASLRPGLRVGPGAQLLVQGAVQLGPHRLL